MRFLDRTLTPSDIKSLSIDDLEVLSHEIREMIISTVLKTGGHLASSLGAVELAVALHYVFDSPADRIIWDVGHQAYAHKIITGRMDKFHTLRQLNGISGFPHVSESVHDAITVGHSSTSISAGLGMSAAKCLKNDPANVICVIGDGSMTAGMSFEALNHAGDSKKRLIVILNDNEMSISPNVGALSSFLSRKLSGKYFQELRKEFGEFLKSLPKIGDDIYKFAKRSEESFKTFVTPGMLFEALNFDYFGPINGHKLSHLVNILNNIKNLEGPILLHVTTKKGKGYRPAEENPTAFHGVAPSTTEKTNNFPTYTKIFGSTLCQMAENNEKITAITAAMPDGTGLLEFQSKFPKRFFDVGIAEQHAVTFSAGLSIEGFTPFVAIYSTFLQRAYDQVIHDVCLDGHHVIFAMDRGGIVGEDGPTHHGAFDLSYLRPIPNITIMAPSSGDELVRMLKTAESMDSPVAIRYPRGNSEKEDFISYDKAEAISPLNADLLKNGEDILIIAIGSMVNPAKKACQMLEEKGFSPSLIDARFVKPLDEKMICSMAENISNIITIEENALIGGFGSAVLELFAEKGIGSKNIIRMGIKDEFVTQGTPEELKNLFDLNPEGILKNALKLLNNDK
ncbi:MAG: 1-deoxy-D-xylulose-5-phosphate synthase [Desulfobacteraceae bacterium]|nr:1-deoxy-D-xylulose-5-phosphate synthase [Desulfobacteraceae bacterium]